MTGAGAGSHVCVCVWDRDLRMWCVKEGGTDPEQQTL